MVLKPKSKKNQFQSQSSDSSSNWPLGIPPLSSARNSKAARRIILKISAVFTGFCLIVYIFSRLFYPHGATSNHTNPVAHGLYLNEMPASSRLIFPHVEHATILKEIGTRGLYVLRSDIEGNKEYVYKTDDKPLTDEQKKKAIEQVFLVKKSFLDHGKLVYRKKSDEPEIVVVTLVDFERYELENIVKVVQNRVDYAQLHGYGIYVRWIQEFIPAMKDQTVDSNYDFYKPMIMRAAMHAFPRAKKFLFVDQDSLIMNLDLSLKRHLLDRNILDLALLRNVPIRPGSNVKTYENLNLDTVSLIFPQDDTGMLDLSSFVVSNDHHSRAFLEFLLDPLVRDFDWADTFSGTVSHMLQWHPQLLARAAVVVPKIMASEYDATISKDAVSDAFHYKEGDLIASFKGCRAKKSCFKLINEMYGKITKK